MKNFKLAKIEKPLHKRIKALAREKGMKLEGMFNVLLIKALEAK
jgi:hypothetical protein